MLRGNVFPLVPLSLLLSNLSSLAPATSHTPLSFRATAPESHPSTATSGLSVPVTSTDTVRDPHRATASISDSSQVLALTNTWPSNTIPASLSTRDCAPTGYQDPYRTPNPGRISFPATVSYPSRTHSPATDAPSEKIPSSAKFPASTKAPSPARSFALTRASASDTVPPLFISFARDPVSHKSLARGPIQHKFLAREAAADRSPIPTRSLASGAVHAKSLAGDPTQEKSLSRDPFADGTPVTARFQAGDPAPAISLLEDPSHEKSQAKDPPANGAPFTARFQARYPAPAKSVVGDPTQEKSQTRDPSVEEAPLTAKFQSSDPHPVRSSALQRSSGEGQALREAVARAPFKKVPKDALALALRLPRARWERAAGAVAVVDLGDGQRWLRVLHGEAMSPVVLWRANLQPIWGSAPLWLEQQDAYVLAATDRRRVVQFLKYDMKITGSYHTSGGALMMYNLTMKENAPIIVSLWNEHLQLSNYYEKEVNTLTYKILRGLKEIGAYFKVLLIEEKPPSIVCVLVTWIEGFIFMTEPSGLPILSFVHEIALDGLRNTRGMQVPTLYPDVPLFRITEIPEVVCAFGPYFRHIKVIEEHFNMRFVIAAELKKHLTDHSKSETKPMYEKYLLNGEVVIIPVSFNPRRPQKIIQGTSSIDPVILITPVPGPLPAWSLPLRVFGGAIWAALLGAIVAYALAWRVVACQSLLASVAAALRAFSSCGGPPQDRVSATPQRLQLASVLLTSAVIVASAYQGRLFSLINDPDTYPTVDTLEDLERYEIPVACCAGSCITLRDVAKHRNVNLQEKPIYMDEMDSVVISEEPHAHSLYLNHGGLSGGKKK